MRTRESWTRPVLQASASRGCPAIGGRRTFPGLRAYLRTIPNYESHPYRSRSSARNGMFGTVTSRSSSGKNKEPDDSEVSPGTPLTRNLASSPSRPLRTMGQRDIAEAFERQRNQGVVRSGNVAGPRQRESPGAYEASCGSSVNCWV